MNQSYPKGNGLYALTVKFFADLGDNWDPRPLPSNPGK